MSNLQLNTAESKTRSVKKTLMDNYGLGRKLVESICKPVGICGNLKTGDLSSEQLEELEKVLNYSKLKVNNELKKELVRKFEASVQIKSYKGLRKVKGYPANGQRTRSNARTARKKKLF